MSAIGLYVECLYVPRCNLEVRQQEEVAAAVLRIQRKPREVVAEELLHQAQGTVSDHKLDHSTSTQQQDQ
jgi:hypothetical protein